jgi:hypothetical protein
MTRNPALLQLRAVIDDWRSGRLPPDEAIRQVGQVLGAEAAGAPGVGGRGRPKADGRKPPRRPSPQG